MILGIGFSSGPIPFARSTQFSVSRHDVDGEAETKKAGSTWPVFYA
ncbi:hypothetical protein [Pseudomonas frederiksbergensis]